jgi:hypothetical protein
VARPAREYGAPTTVWRYLKRWERIFAVYRWFFALVLARICLDRLM